MGGPSGIEVDAVVKDTVKSKERRNGASITCTWGLGPKKNILAYDV